MISFHVKEFYLATNGYMAENVCLNLEKKLFDTFKSKKVIQNFWFVDWEKIIEIIFLFCQILILITRLQRICSLFTCFKA